MIDNIELIKPLLNFESDGEFYQVLILKRKKDQPENEKDNHQSVRTIKTYYIDSKDYLDKRYDEIKSLCELFKARAYIQINKQNHRDVGLDMISEISLRIKNGSYNQSNIFDSVVGQIKTQEKRWIVDIDTKDELVVHRIAYSINQLRPEGDKIIKCIPTKNGYHLITERFDIKSFSEKFPNVDIQKKNPTLLYYPNSMFGN